MLMRDIEKRARHMKMQMRREEHGRLRDTCAKMSKMTHSSSSAGRRTRELLSAARSSPAERARAHLAGVQQAGRRPWHAQAAARHSLPPPSSMSPPPPRRAPPLMGQEGRAGSSGSG